MENISEWKKFKKEAASAKPWHLIHKANYVNDSVAHERLSICTGCPEFIKITGQCKQCGCIMKLKTLLKQATCPLNKW